MEKSETTAIYYRNKSNVVDKLRQNVHNMRQEDVALNKAIGDDLDENL